MTLPSNYAEKVYAGILGKIIGVYIGRPFEGWPHEKIDAELGEIRGYVNDRLGQPLVVTDDDISGTFTFFRALEDYGYSKDLTSEQIGQSWLNYIIEDRTILWWGGMGMSTEHTAFLRLKNGAKAPTSGCIATNGKTVAEQIGAQIFIEGWGLVSPGDPAQAASFAKRAGSVSHDGESVYAAQVIAAMVAAAFISPSGLEAINRLIDTGLEQIPADCLIAQVIADERAWHASGMTWREAFAETKAKYGYDKFGGACHVVPNHALVILALLHGAGDFSESQMIVNTCGWDTDCNAANVGSILGVLSGLSAFDGPVDWRGPVADRMYLPAADGGRCITDALRETDEIIRAYCRLNGIEYEAPKNGARFHFSQPGSLQGFAGFKNRDGRLIIDAPGRAMTPTFTPPLARSMPGYSMVASPTLVSGQVISANVIGGPYRICIGVYDANDQIVYHASDEMTGHGDWKVPDPAGYPIAEVGIEATGPCELDWLTCWHIPDCTFLRVPGSTWREAWVNGASQFSSWPQAFSVTQNEGTGLVSTGTREWTDYKVRADLTLPLCDRAGIAIRVQGLKRYIALMLCRDNFARLIEVLDGENVLAEVPFEWTFDQTYSFWLRADHDTILGGVGDYNLFEAKTKLSEGGIALVVTNGRVGTDEIAVIP